jgi:hypothetical protein
MSAASRCLLITLVALAGTAAAATAQLPGAGANAGEEASAVRSQAARRLRIDPRRFAGRGCSARTAVPRIAYDLGARFEALPAEHPEYICIPAPRRPREVQSGPLVAWGYVSVVYGTCDASQGSCAPPLEIQDAPQCARNPNSYNHNPGFPPEPEAENVYPSQRVRLSPAPWIPALALEQGQRIEVFAGRTTVVVFATDARLAKRAGDALARAIAREDPRSSARRLRAEARQPGDGAACHSFRGRL